MTHAGDLFGHAPPALLVRLAQAAMADAEIKRRARGRGVAAAAPRQKCGTRPHAFRTQAASNRRKVSAS